MGESPVGAAFRLGGCFTINSQVSISHTTQAEACGYHDRTVVCVVMQNCRDAANALLNDFVGGNRKENMAGFLFHLSQKKFYLLASTSQVGNRLGSNQSQK